jgi:hypothetical protein
MFAVGMRRYSIREACAATGLSRATLYRARAEGRLQMIEHEGRTFIQADELARFMAEARPLPPRGAPRRGAVVKGDAVRL